MTVLSPDKPSPIFEGIVSRAPGVSSIDADDMFGGIFSARGSGRLGRRPETLARRSGR